MPVTPTEPDQLGAAQPADGTGDEEHSRWRPLTRVAVAVGALLMVAMWAGIFLGFFDRTAPGTMTDRSFSQAAEPVCAGAKAQLDTLPKAFQTSDHVQRAAVVAQSDDILRAMVTQLHALAPTAGRDGKMAQEWLTDWDHAVDDRDDYVRRLREDTTARFYEREKSKNEQLSKPVSRFAYVNKMPSCDVPGDLS